MISLIKCIHVFMLWILHSLKNIQLNILLYRKILIDQEIINHVKRMISPLSEQCVPGIEYIKKLEIYTFIFNLIITNSYITHKNHYFYDIVKCKIPRSSQNGRVSNDFLAAFLCSAAEGGPRGCHTPLEELRRRQCAVRCSQASKAAVEPYNIFKAIKVSPLTEISRIARCRRLEKESFKGHTLWEKYSPEPSAQFCGDQGSPQSRPSVRIASGS